MKNPQKICQFPILILLLLVMVSGCSGGRTQSSATVTLFEIPFGHVGKASNNKTPAENANDLPTKLGDLNLAKVVQNKEAARIINKMHGKRLDDCKNIIAHYGNSDAKNILYVSIYDNEQKARTSLKKMAMKMAGGSSVFSPLTQGKLKDHAYFETAGMGLKHYFYRVGNVLIWWQVEPDKAEATFNDLLEFNVIPFNGLLLKRKSF